MNRSQPAIVLALAKSKGVVRARELDQIGVSRAVLGRLVAQGALVRTQRGLYVEANRPPTENHPLAELAARVPGAVVNLLSALAFHQVIEAPEVPWVAIGQGRQAPRLHERIEITWAPARLLYLGVTVHDVEGVDVPVTDLARTVADCFKFRNRLGIDIGIGALREYIRRRADPAVLWEMATECRVQNIMRPYLETLERVA